MPLVVAKPFWSTLTLIVTGTPPSGPGLAARDRGIDRIRLRQHVIGPMIDHRIDRGIDRIEPGQRRVAASWADTSSS